MSLYEQLKEYSKSDMYPFHMPGHKRNLKLMSEVYGEDVVNPYGIDITEIDGFDDLHHADGILHDAMERMAKATGAVQSFFSVNGSTGGILAAIYAACPSGSYVLTARNCHRSVAHAMSLFSLNPQYIYPLIGDKMGISMGISKENVEECMLEAEKEGKIPAAVVITSPTYEGVVSDIRGIAEVVHAYGTLLIVDEAHGAHFPFGEDFPDSAVTLGADLVIQSLHKTLPSVTQTAVLHVCTDWLDMERVKEGLRIFETSSPSYLMMAGMDACMTYMNGKGRERMLWLSKELDTIYREAKKLKELYILNEADVKAAGSYDFDKSKLVIGTKRLHGCGRLLHRLLREDYHLQPEMSTPEYVLMMSTIGDTKEGLMRLMAALSDLDKRLSKLGRRTKKAPAIKEGAYKKYSRKSTIEKADIVCSIFDAQTAQKEKMKVLQCEGRICAEMAYIYPPGIPFLMPGERIKKSHIELLTYYRSYGLEIHGLRDRKAKRILVAKLDESEE